VQEQPQHSVDANDLRLLVKRSASILTDLDAIGG
jgi:hypothetical protein